MKNATKNSPARKRAVKRVSAKKKAAKRVPGNKAAVPQADSSQRARAALEALATRESETISARAAVLVALTDISGLVAVGPDGAITPFGLFTLTFGDPRVGLDDGQMVLLYGKVSTAIGNDRVGALIEKHLTSQASAAVVIRDVTDLIQIWIDDPSVEA